MSKVDLPIKYKSPLKRLKRRLKGKTLIQPEFDTGKCIFVHVPKAAGTSVKNTLFPNAVGLTHHLAMDYRLDNPRKFKSYFVFTFVRNPFDRLVSAYNYLMQGGKNEEDRNFRDTHLLEYDDFGDFVRRGLSKPEIATQYHFMQQRLFLVDFNGRLIVDFIGRFEDIRNDFQEITRELGVEVELPHKNKSIGDSYQSCYTEELRKIAYRHYKADFDLLDYEPEIPDPVA